MVLTKGEVDGGVVMDVEKIQPCMVRAQGFTLNRILFPFQSPHSLGYAQQVKSSKTIKYYR
jgi:hypothetical protein